MLADVIGLRLEGIEVYRGAPRLPGPTPTPPDAALSCSGADQTGKPPAFSG
jgi:hypothetical protein